MNNFETLVNELRKRFESADDARFELGRPVRKDGLWTLSIVCNDGYLLEIAWQKHRGYAISAGYEDVLGEGFDELCANADMAFARAAVLFESREPTLHNAPLTIADLRKLKGVLQNDLAQQVGMTKSGLAQLEKAGSLGRMQVVTIEKLLSGLGGELVLIAKLANGETRELVG